MKKPSQLIVLFGVVSALATARDCSAQFVLWHPVPGEMEFGVTAVVGSTAVEVPSVFEAGYNGANLIGNSEFYGMGQTFTVPSLRTLQSIELRVGGMNDEPVSGQFEVAIYRFDTLSGSPAEKLAGVLVNGQDYWHINLTQVPVSSFDFSSFDLSLNPAQTYALAVTPTATYRGGLLSLQGATDIYSGGTAYFLSVIPEPSTIGLCGLGTVLTLGMNRRRRMKPSLLRG